MTYPKTPPGLNAAEWRAFCRLVDQHKARAMLSKVWRREYGLE